MKRFVFCILLFFVLKGGEVVAQSKWDFGNDIHGTGNYEGLWIYQSNDTIFKLQLLRCEPSRESMRDVFGGLFSISVGGKEIYSTMHLKSKVDSIMSLEYSSLRETRLRRTFHLLAASHFTKERTIDHSYMDFTIGVSRVKAGKRYAQPILTQNTLRLLSPDKLEWKIILRPEPDAYKYIGELDSQGNPPAYAYPLPDYAILTKVLE